MGCGDFSSSGSREGLSEWQAGVSHGEDWRRAFSAGASQVPMPFAGNKLEILRPRRKASVVATK